MKNLDAMALLLCVCFLLPFTLNAQQTYAEDTTVYKMSFEKADSILISLSRGKPRNVNVSYEKEPGNSFFLIDTMAPVDESVSAPDSFLSDGNEDLPKIDANPTIDRIPDVNETSPLERNRKRATVNRSDLLVEQDGSKLVVKDEENVDYRDLRSINEGTLIGVGGYKMKDEYLSDIGKYGGVGIRFMNERMRLTKLANSKISRQNIVNVDMSSAINGAENANFLSAFVDYSIGYHYRFLPDPFFKILVGGSARGMLGMVYSTRNGNNPMTLHADIDLNFSLIAIYEFRIKKYPLAIRYQFESPFAGVLFSPVYDQSYYEIFSLGNTAEIFNFNSFNNKLAMRNYLTLDFPVGGMTTRVGYFGSYYTTSVHNIDRYIISHNFMLGFVKEFVAFGGREMRRRNLFHSAYY